jgi:branched-subunit amino acid permease
MHTWLTMLTLFAISYLLLYVMFTYRPQHVVDFIGHPLGALLFLAVILLQAVGFVWLTSLSRVKF